MAASIVEMTLVSERVKARWTRVTPQPEPELNITIKSSKNENIAQRNVID